MDPKSIDYANSIVKIESQNNILKKMESILYKFKVTELRILSHSIGKKSRFWTLLLKKAQIIDYLKLHFLRLYIKNSLNKILIDHNLRKLIKSEIFKVKGDIFSEFLGLYFDIMQELEDQAKSENLPFELINDQIKFDFHEKRDNYTSD